MLYYIAIPVAWLLWHIGFRIQVIGRENLKNRGTKGFIIAPTHISAIDPVFVVLARFWGKRMMVFAKKELFEMNAFITWFIRQCGAVMVRGTRDEVDTMNDTIEYCRSGGGLLIFPEGTREKEGELIPPKSGVFVVAAQAGVNPNTMQRAMAQLEQDGLAVANRTAGRTVTEDAAVIQEARRARAMAAVAECLRVLADLGYAPEEAAEIIREGLNHE